MKLLKSYTITRSSATHPETKFTSILQSACCYLLAIVLLAGPRADAENSVNIPPDGVSVPMLSLGGRPGLNVRINGQGPFPFVIDTGANRTVIEPTLARELSLPSASDGIVIKSLQIGAANLRQVPAMVGQLLAMPGQGDSPRGVLSALSFHGYLLTFDFPRKQITLRPGALGEANDKTIFSYGQGEEFPTVPVNVAGHDVQVHLDTGAPVVLALPTKYKDEAPVNGKLEEGFKVRTPSGEFPIYRGTLKGDIRIGGYTLGTHEIFFTDAAPAPNAPPHGQLGSAALNYFVVTLDSLNRRIQLAKAETSPDSKAAASEAPTKPMLRIMGPGDAPKPYPEAAAIPQPKNDEDLAHAITQLADQLSSARRFSGSIFLAAAGKSLVDKAWGEADRKAKRPNTSDTAYDVGSIGKLFTQIAILQLVEEGKLSLDNSIGKYLTNYPDSVVAAKVTIRQLLLHTSGIPDFLSHITPDTKFDGIVELKDFLPLFAGKPLDFEPGSRTQYSSSGYIVLGLIVEAVSQSKYAAYVQQHILKPAAMTHSGFFDRSQLPASVARSYEDGEDVTGMHPRWGSSAGGLQASAGDLFRLVEAINAGKLIEPESIAILRSMIPRPPDAAPPANPTKLAAYGIQGGAPGVNGLLSIDSSGRYIRVVLCNAGPPMASSMGVTIGEWMNHMPK
ncbi:MAG: serine hydrolase [Verrucomicrobia bacterium]|nr:serine hydrolase [Verrucomicrobiota bacterium]